VIRTRAVLVPLTLVLAGGVTLAACGSSSSGSSAASTSSSVAATTPAAAASTPAASTPTAAGPVLVGASAVPAVTGPQGKQPTIAKPTMPAPTTLLAHDVIVGTGPAAESGDTVSANYTLALYSNGSLVQTSYTSGSPFSFTIGAGQAIQGFDEGVVGMKAGGRRELVIPPALGYMDQAQQGIPANSTLIFVVDAVSVTAGS
jgi:peptidylprolyl isomerase